MRIVNKISVASLAFQFGFFGIVGIIGNRSCLALLAIAF
jgi:hypothetical protein